MHGITARGDVAPETSGEAPSRAHTLVAGASRAPVPDDQGELVALAALAAAAVGAPLGASELAASDGRWARGPHGLDAEGAGAASSLVAAVLNRNGPLLIEDARTHAGFADAEGVRRAPFLRFFAGVPIREGAHAIGVVWVADTRPRPVGTVNVGALETAARNAARLRLEARPRESSSGGDAFRDRFLSAVSHDLRTPLSAITCSAGLLPRLGQLTDAQERSVGRIRSSALRIEERVRDIIDYTRSRLGGKLRIERQATDVTDLGADVIARQRALHPGRSIELDSQGGGAGFWDAARVAQLLSNLVLNAVEFGAPAMPVKLSIEGGARSVHFGVHNEGVPIDERVLENIFDPTRRPQQGTERRGSLGLGLHLAREIALAHGGKIAVQSAHGAGTTFSVVLPREAC